MENTQITDKLKALSERTVDEALTATNIESFLNVVSSCAMYGAENLLLIWKQNHEANEVAGIQKWKLDGKSLKNDAFPIMILLPCIRCTDPGSPVTDEEGQIKTDENKAVLYETPPSYEYGYVPTPVFDISQVSGDIVIVNRDMNLVIEKLHTIGFIFSEEDADKMPPGNADGYSSIEDTDMVFHIPKNIVQDKTRYHMTLLSLFVDTYLLGVKDPWDPELPVNNIDILSICIKYCLHRYFLKSSHLNPKLCAGKIKKLTHEDKLHLIYQTAELAFQYIQMLTTSQLSFTETAVVNGVLDTGDSADMTALIQRLVNVTEDDLVLSRSINGLPDKYIQGYTDCLADLYQKKLDEKIIYSVPPVQFPIVKGDLKL